MNVDMWIEKMFGNAAHSWPEFEGFCRTHQPLLITAEPRLGKREFYTRYRTSGASHKIDLFYDEVYGKSFGDYPSCLADEKKIEERRRVLLSSYQRLTELRKEIVSSSGSAPKVNIGLIVPGRWMIDAQRMFRPDILAGYIEECKKAERAQFGLAGKVVAF